MHLHAHNGHLAEALTQPHQQPHLPPVKTHAPIRVPDCAEHLFFASDKTNLQFTYPGYTCCSTLILQCSGRSGAAPCAVHRRRTAPAPSPSCASAATGAASTQDITQLAQVCVQDSWSTHWDEAHHVQLLKPKHQGTNSKLAAQ